MVRTSLPRIRVAALCLAVLVGLLVALAPGGGGVQAAPAPAVMAAPAVTKAKAKRGLTVRFERLSAGSVAARVLVRAPRGAKCTLTVSSGKRATRLPLVKSARKGAGWGWILSPAKKRQSVKVASSCRAKGRTTRAAARRTVKHVSRGSGELVLAGSVSIPRGRLVHKQREGTRDAGGGSKGGIENPGDPGWCTWGAWNLAPWLGTSVTGHARNWAVSAAANGLKTGTIPAVGAVYVGEYGTYGHVGVVTGVQGSTFTMRDMNGGTRALSFEAAGNAKNMGAYGRSEWNNFKEAMTVDFGIYRDRTRTVDKTTKFIYKPNEAPNQYEGQIVQWDGDRKTQKTAWLVQQGKRFWIPTSAIYWCLKGRGVGGPAVLSAGVLDSYPDQNGQWANCTSGGISIGSGNPPPDDGWPPTPTVWPEQQGSLGANTFTNPYNASGMGPRIAAFQWVDVSCKVYAPQIASANPDGYWYRIRSAPWNDQYYAVANTFWNGDVPGQTPYTHNTDFNVPNC